MGKRQDKQRAKIDEFMQSELQPGERIVAVLGQSETGANPSIPLLMMLGSLTGGVKWKAFVVTSSRVVVLRVKGGSSVGVREVEESYPKDAVSVTAFAPRPLWSKLVLALGSEPLELNVHQSFRDSAEQFVQALGGVKTAA